jgi:NhaA family Na+:H+ antiporter
MRASELNKGRLLRAVVRPFQAFLQLEAASGIVLLTCAAAALVWANVHAASYHALFEDSSRTGVALGTLINDGLMTAFFFVVGMEVKRELALGELSTFTKAALPAIAAVGGMVAPALIFLAFNGGGPGQLGWGIPMATDIAFCIGILTLLRDRVPHALVVFVTALAIFDDIGSILVIAIFYGRGIDLAWLAAACAPLAVLFVMNRRGASRGWAYALVGVALWYALHHAGIHAAIAGVIVGLAIPAASSDDVDDRSPLDRLIDRLHTPVAFVVMPLFALANTGISLRSIDASTLASPVTLGVTLGLVLGKPLGIVGCTWLAVRLGLSSLPGNGSMRTLLGVSVVAGIGFTVALFIATLAYSDAAPLLVQAKAGILLGSIVAGIGGVLLLRR